MEEIKQSSVLRGYKGFDIAARLFADLFPARAKVIDGDCPEMVRIYEALEEAARLAGEPVDKILSTEPKARFLWMEDLRE